MAVVGRRQMSCARGSGGGTVGDTVGEENEREREREREMLGRTHLSLGGG